MELTTCQNIKSYKSNCNSKIYTLARSHFSFPFCFHHTKGYIRSPLYLHPTDSHTASQTAFKKTGCVCLKIEFGHSKLETNEGPKATLSAL